MKYIELLLIFVFMGIVGKAENTDNLQDKIINCKFRDKKLYERLKVLTAFSDFKVGIEGGFPDLKVRKEDSHPNDCEKWQFVDSFENFTVMFVDFFEDFSIKHVENFPESPDLSFAFLSFAFTKTNT